MTRRLLIGALWPVALAHMVAAQTPEPESPAIPSPRTAKDGSSGNGILVMKTAGQPERQLQILKTNHLPDGDVVVEVRDLSSGHVYTLTNPPGMSATGSRSTASLAPSVVQPAVKPQRPTGAMAPTERAPVVPLTNPDQQRLSLLRPPANTAPAGNPPAGTTARSLHQSAPPASFAPPPRPRQAQPQVAPPAEQPGFIQRLFGAKPKPVPAPRVYVLPEQNDSAPKMAANPPAPRPAALPIRAIEPVVAVEPASAPIQAPDLSANLAPRRMPVVSLERQGLPPAQVEELRTHPAPVVASMPQPLPATIHPEPVAPAHDPEVIVPAVATGVQAPPLTPVAMHVPTEPTGDYEFEVIQREFQAHLETLRTHARPSFRIEAAADLLNGRFARSPEVLQALVHAVQHDPEPVVRGYCIRCLSVLEHADTEYIRRLGLWAKAPEPVVALAAQEALTHLTGR